MNASKSSLWLIDLDGTLYKPSLVKWGMALELLVSGWAALKIITAFRKAHEELRDEAIQEPERLFRPSPFDEQLKRAASASNAPPARVRRLIKIWMFQRPGKWLRISKRTSLLKEIENFRAAGGKTALVSDYPAQEKLKAMGIEHLFDLVVANGETEGLARLKPAPDSILFALEKFATKPSRALMIGDRLDADGAAAKAAGVEFRLIS